uniref:BHLH domain-containing protein n=1 Tax=Rodentolepis nana TaxID=102285 RepID=A0A0R3TBR6_RODNA
LSPIKISQVVVTRHRLYSAPHLETLCAPVFFSKVLHKESEMSHYASASKSSEGDFGGDDDDMEDDDGYDLSDYEGDMDGGITDPSEAPTTSADRRSENYSSRCSLHHADKPSTSRHRTEFRRFRNASERLTEHTDDNRRDHHNHLERKRRASIKGSYCDLREAIPSLRGSKASRAVTLQRAAEYIESLKKSNHEHSICVDELNRQNELLERQVQDLYRNYQRLENDEYALTQAVAAAGGSSNGQSSPFSAPAPPTSLPVVTSGTSSTGNSTPTAAPLALNGSSSGGSNSLSSGFTAPVRVVSQHNQASNNSNTSSPDDPPPIPSSGLAQLSYAAMQLQQQQSTSSPTTSTKSSVVTKTTTTTSQVPRLITLETPSTTGGARSGVIPQRIRLSNSLSTTSGGRPIVVVPSATTGTSATLSALDTAVIKARNAPRPTGQDNQQQVIVGSNVEVVSSNNTTTTHTGTNQPRRVVIVSAQHHQEFPAIATSKSSPSN